MENPLSQGPASTYYLVNEGQRYFETDESSYCPITSYSIAVTCGSSSSISLDTSSGNVQVEAWTDQDYVFTITACGASSSD